jgi:hypothetical protein
VLPLFPGSLIQINCRPSIGIASCFQAGDKKEVSAVPIPPPTWTLHVLAWSLTAIGLIAIARMAMAPWSVN